MRVIGALRLEEHWRRYTRSAGALRRWHALARAARPAGPEQARETFPEAETAETAAGRHLLVTPAGDWRIVAAADYARQTLYVLRVLGRAEFDRGDWKEEL